MAKEKLLHDLFLDTLKDIYFAEKKILATLPKMAKAAQSEELKAAFEKHRTETEGQIERLEKVFAVIEQNRISYLGREIGAAIEQVFADRRKKLQLVLLQESGRPTVEDLPEYFRRRSHVVPTGRADWPEVLKT